MFYLKDMPDEKTVKEVSSRYADYEPSAILAFLWFLRTGSGLLTFVENVLNRWGLSQGRFITLSILTRFPNEPISPSVLADQVGVTRATMTGLLDGLERDGHIKRMPHPEDRRGLLVGLTSQGRELMDELFPRYFKVVSKLMADISEEERSLMIQLMEKFTKAMPQLLAEQLRATERP